MDKNKLRKLDLVKYGSSVRTETMDVIGTSRERPGNKSFNCPEDV